MAKWNHVSLERLREVDDIMSILREAGAGIEELRGATGRQTLDQGEQVLNDTALWAALPPHARIWSRQELHDWLKAALDASR